jgi:type IV secretory pathway TraG/TraD family ATPase VirD4
VRDQPAGRHPARRLLASAAVIVLLVGFVSGLLLWVWTQAGLLVLFRSPARLPLDDAARGMWRALISGGWRDPAAAFPTRTERLAAPPPAGYLLSGALTFAVLALTALRGRRALRSVGAGSPLGREPGSIGRLAVDRGWVAHRTWAAPSDLRRLWVHGPASGRPYLGWVGRRPQRRLAAEAEVQPMLVAPPRAGKTTGLVIPWLLEHDGPALALSTKRDVLDATLERRRRLGRVWVYDPFGTSESAGFTPLVPAATWDGAIRTGEALASAAHPDASNAANEFWDKEAASMLAPLLHAAAVSDRSIGELVRWLDTRDFTDPLEVLTSAGAAPAADQLHGVSRRDERNRETTVMSALNLLRAYRYPQVTAAGRDDLTPARFLDGEANTIYVVAAGHEQDALRPVMLALLTSVYEAAIDTARRDGPIDRRLFVLMDEAANIAPVRNLASWLSQCGDHGMMIATVWQSIAQIDQRYGRPARDAICAASTAQLFLPPLIEPTTTGYLSGVLGDEPVATASGSHGGGSFSAAERKAASAPWLRQIQPGRGILIYRDLPPAVVRAPRWFETRRDTSDRRSRSILENTDM